eukprot:TRINITY_DN1395_c0_g1_i1.p1 TRINITY_DN1395_c0_g1~~TRINITY_DN1395_c0_g1_i1.p1  ORF type:complete len:291 (-),score=37.71 TRINITY_DN1395_c0_g1_i1:586-1458(-)
MNIALRKYLPPLVSRCFALQLSSPSERFHASLNDKLKETPIYFDYQSTTPTDPRVVDAMLPFFMLRYGNAHSKSHRFGTDAESQVSLAREHVAALIGASSKEIVFTSGATESNNLAIKGVAQFAKNANKEKNHVITAQTEHKCVLESARYLSMNGFEVTYLPVNSNGLIDAKEVEKAIKPSTIMVSIMTVNNEIGVIQPIKEIGKICRSKGVYFHTDAAQGLGKIKLDVNEMNVDLMSLSGHKIYGPKGIGAIYIRRKPRVKIETQMLGGGQERGYRSGTLAVPVPFPNA